MYDYFLFNLAADILEDSYQEPPAPEYGYPPSKEYQRWTALNSKAMGALRMTLGIGPKNQARGLKTARQIWSTMKTYQKTGSLVFNQIVQDIWETTLDSSESVTDFANRLRKLNNEAERVGAHCKLPEAWMVQIFLRGLGELFEHFIISFNQSYSIIGDEDSPPITLDFITKKASEHENRMRKTASVNQAKALPTPGPSKWCVFHKTKGHDDKECFRHKKRKHNPRGNHRNDTAPAQASLASRITNLDDDNKPDDTIG